ncbi:SMI1/KNR4 family protein [Streptomyces sp. NPDC091377]|uniref:SMI1/KNR4 family protein n=1 Tax=Streptomyces sp. NPDC091377 TaxID=3365995 RepID=UPI003827DB94
MSTPAQPSPPSALHAFATWEPLLRVLWDANAEKFAAPGGQVAGRIGQGGWSVPVRSPRPTGGRAAQVEDAQEEYDAIQRVRTALAEAGLDDITFTTRIRPDGRAVLKLLARSPAVESGSGGAAPGGLLLVEGALPEPWRRAPEPGTGLGPAPTADPAALERVLRERLPDAKGATEAELAEARERLGVPLPEELKALYRVTRARWEDHDDDFESMDREAEAVGCELFPPSEMYVAVPSTRMTLWAHAAAEAVITRPDDAVQGLVGSPGWLVFGDNGGGDRLAVDLTPGPAGHLGQVVRISHETSIGADLIADSLTDLVHERLADRSSRRRGPDAERPVVAHVNTSGVPGVAAAAHPALEVLSLGVWEDGPMSLAPVLDLPRLRTLSAYPGTLADPVEIGRLKHLEFLRLSPQDWRTLLAAGAVPKTLSAASLHAYGDEDPLPLVELANEILGLWGRPPIVRTRLEGDVTGLTVRG